MENKKNALASRIYANMKAKHPEWSNKKLYHATKWALEHRAPKAEAEAVAEPEVVAEA